jgi:hypothetical protein
MMRGEFDGFLSAVEMVQIPHYAIAYAKIQNARSLSDLGNRSENSAGRGQILTILKVNSCSIGQKSG